MAANKQSANKHIENNQIANNQIENKQIQEKLKESEEKFRGVFDNSIAAICIFDLNKKFTEANQSGLELFGYSREELLQMTIEDLDVDPLAVLPAKKQLMEGGRLINYEHQLRRKDGSIITVLNNSTPLKNTREEVVGLLSTLIDVTERKQSEQEIMVSHQRLLKVLDTIDAFIYVADMETYEVLFINKYGEDLFGNIIGKKCWQTIQVGQTGPCDFCPNDKLLDKDGQSTGTYIWEFKNTLIDRWFDCRDIALHWIDGRIVRLEIAFDVTERKEIEINLRDNKIELAKAYRQLDEEINKVAKLHKRNLPAKLSGVNNIWLAAHYQPAKKVGGDLYNIIRVEDRLVFYLSDVMGHGLDSAMISVFVKEAIGSYISLKPDQVSPKQLLLHLSKEFCKEHYPDDQFVCIFIGTIHLQTMKLYYINAGMQTRPLVFTGQKERKELHLGGLFISNALPIEMYDFKEECIDLTPGTTIFFTTDGLPEQHNGDEMFLQCCRDVFYENALFPPEVIVQAMNKAFFLFNNNSLIGDDDITYLVLQVASGKKEKHTIEIGSSFDVLPELYNQITNLTSYSPVHAEFMICFQEIIVNAIDHGNRFDPDKKVFIELTLTDQYLMAVVEDQGEGFNWLEKIDRSVDIDTCNERGRGISMAGIICSKLFYNQKGNKAIILIENTGNTGDRPFCS